MEPEETDSGDLSSTASEVSNKRGRQSQYPSPPHIFSDDRQFIGIEDEEYEDDLSHRPRKKLRFNVHSEEDASMSEASDEEDLEDYDEEEDNESEDEGRIFQSVEFNPDNEDDEPDSPARKRGSLVSQRGRRIGSKRIVGNEHDKDIWSRSKSERFGRRARDEEGRKIRQKRGKIDVYHETPELRRLTGLVTQAWMDKDWESALMYALEAIKIQPEAFHMHGTVAEILINQGRYQDALDTLFTGVHASKIPDNWWYVVARLNEISEISEGRADRAIGDKLQHCYSRIIDLEPKNYDARLLRMKWNLERDLYKRARNDCLYLLRLRPTDTYVVERLAELSGILEEPEAALECFTKYIPKVLENETPEDTTFRWSTLASYTELLLNAQKYTEGLQKLRSLSRWLLGRTEETFWDDYSDDREWDVYSDPRREDSKEFISGRFDEDTYGFGLPLELRVRLGTLRLLSGQDQLEEAMGHYEFLLGVVEDEDLDTSDYLELFREAADALRESGHFSEALEFYNVLKETNQNLNSRFYFDLAICYQALGRNDDMRAAVQHMRYGDRDPTMQMGLAKIYESQGRIDLMWRLCLELKKMGFQELLAKNNLPIVRPATLSVLDENVPLPISFSRLRARPLKVVKPPKRLGNLTMLQLKQEEAARDLVTKALFDDMCNLAQPIADGDINARSEWMRLASEIFEEFRGYSKFFPSDPLKLYDEKDKERVVAFPTEEEFPDQLEFELPKTWRDIALDDLVDLILQYAIFLADDGAKALCFNVLRLLERSSLAWAHRERRTVIGNVRLHCAIKLHDAIKANECGRTFFKSDPFSTNSYRLPSAIHRAVHGDAEAFGYGPEQKFWLRQIKILDFLTMTPKERDKFYKTKKALRVRDGVEQTVKSQNLNIKDAGLDPDLLALYGHMLLVAGAATTSLNYYFRAYVLRPDDAIINLCLALGYLNWAWKRQSSNRQYMIQQGFAFLSRYAELRRKVAIETEDDAKLQEVEFNEAMAYGHMGLFHLAVPRLMKCLEIGDRIEAKSAQKQNFTKPQKKVNSKGKLKAPLEAEDLNLAEANGIKARPPENFTPEAAFALRNILALNGDLHGAHGMMKKYLVL